jgi:hypothetical protein
MTQTLTGQDIGQAHHATRAVLERVLTAAGLGFKEWVVVNTLGGNDSGMTTDDVSARVGHGLKITEDAARIVLTGVQDRDLVTRPPGRLELTTAGALLFQRVTEAIAGITERLYGGLPAEELVIAHRLLATVTARANAELGGRARR